MLQQLYFFLSIALALVAWSVVAARYVWPALRHQSREEALRPLLTLHSFRFIGLAFLVPGVVSPALSSAFAQAAGYGDAVASVLALLSLALLPRAAGFGVAWIFNIWGTVDLLDAFYQAGSHGLQAGQLGTMYFVPTVLVPMLLISHALMFRILARREPASALLAGRTPA
jgi:hypothetical protein